MVRQTRNHKSQRTMFETERDRGGERVVVSREYEQIPGFVLASRSRRDNAKCCRESQSLCIKPVNLASVSPIMRSVSDKMHHNQHLTIRPMMQS